MTRTQNAAPDDAVRRQDLVDGPSLSDMATSYVYGGNNQRQSFTVVFQAAQTKDGSKWLVQIDSLQREDGSGHIHNFTGHILSFLDHQGREVKLPRPRYVRGCFMTHTRQGSWLMSESLISLAAR
jgi:hypothetical protein